MTRRPLAIVSVLVAMFVAVGLSVGYTAYSRKQDDRQWCALVSTLDDTYRQQPPTTDLGRQIAAEMHRLRQRFGCP